MKLLSVVSVDCPCRETYKNGAVPVNIEGIEGIDNIKTSSVSTRHRRSLRYRWCWKIDIIEVRYI